ncbi:pyridoxamine 5'-phosphate oxidase family protein [Candidatus Bathyarchaeota archaeon]|nr:pyridoxamine 5'-phosphate oxidase family protein [Candidatus Bathyarchaeota archaeon]
MVRVKLPRMSKAEIDQLLTEQLLCRIAFGGKLAPYIAPFQYVFISGVLYFHFTDYGKKMSLLEEGNPVCVEIEQYTPDLSEYCFVVLIGKLHIVEDLQEKVEVISQMVEAAEAKGLSTNFLPAHGVPKDAGWSVLNTENPLVVVRLVDVTKIVGLKSP